MSIKRPTRGWSAVAGLSAAAAGFAFAGTVILHDPSSNDIYLQWFGVAICFGASAFSASQAVVTIVEPTRWRMLNWLAFASPLPLAAVAMCCLWYLYGWAVVAAVASIAIALGAYVGERQNSEPVLATAHGSSLSDAGDVPLAAAGIMLVSDSGGDGGE